MEKKSNHFEKVLSYGAGVGMKKALKDKFRWGGAKKNRAHVRGKAPESTRKNINRKKGYRKKS